MDEARSAWRRHHGWRRGLWVLAVVLAILAGWMIGWWSSRSASPAVPPPSQHREWTDPWPAAPEDPSWPDRRLQLVAKPKKTTKESLPLAVSVPTSGRWRLAEPLADTSRVRLELRLGPRGIPRWRFVGPSTLTARHDSTWVEFIQGKADQVLKFKIECELDETLEVKVTPHFQLAPTGAVARLTEQTQWQANQFTTMAQLRVERQLSWIATASKGKSAGKGKPAGPPPAMKVMLLNQQAVLREARQRLDRLQELKLKLERTVELEMRAVLGDEGTPLRLEKVTDAEPESGPRDAPAPRVTLEALPRESSNRSRVECFAASPNGQQSVNRKGKTMGTWGGGIFEDDEAQDARDAYREILSEGLDGPKATDRFLKEWKGAMKDSDDGPVIWFALADTQWNLGRLEDRVRQAAIRLIDDESSLDRWREAGSKALAKRRQVLQKLKDKLLSPQPAPKKIKVAKPLAPILPGKALKPAELRKQLRALYCSLEPGRGGALTSVICRSGLTDTLLQALGSCAETLEKLWIAGSAELTEAGLRTIGHLPKLKALSLRDLALTDKLVQSWQLPHLQYLELRGRALTDAGIAAFSQCTGLTEIDLGGTAIGAKTLAWISQLPKLTKLWIRSTRVADRDLEGLKMHRCLEQLYLAGTQITDQSLPVLASLPNLEWLDLASTKITDQTVAGLTRQTSLRGLDLQETAVTDRSIPALVKLKNLTYLNIEKTKITKDGQGRLKAEHPSLG